MGIAPDLVLTGGVARNAGIVQALREQLEMDVAVPEHPEIAGALGAALLARVFAFDMRVCGRCGGAMKVRRAVTDPSRIAAMLPGARPPPQPPPPGQLALWGR